jgi:hypothetical protein
MVSTSSTGAIGELQFAINCISLGINTSIPVLHDSPYDVVTEYNGIFYRVQVKYTGSDELLTSNTMYWNMSRSYSSNEVDFLALYSSGNGKTIIIPIKEVDGKTKIRYTEGGKYEKYINAFHLLKK